MKHITNITAIALGVVFSLGHICIAFAREVMIRVYHDLGGPELILPVPADVCLKLTRPAFLLALTAALFLALAVSELRISQERNRFLVQLGCAGLWLLFMAFCLAAFMLPLYIPEIIITD